jgi:hypothetical protein
MCGEIWGIVENFYKHLLPNAIDACYLAIDSGIAAQASSHIEIKFYHYPDRKKITIQIRDTGPGFPEEILRLLMHSSEHFSQSTKNGENVAGHYLGGKGLGLKEMVKEVLLQNGDKVGVLSRTTEERRRITFTREEGDIKKEALVLDSKSSAETGSLVYAVLSYDS